MNIVYYDSDDFKTSQLYRKFLNENEGTGLLNIRAYTANEALPLSNVRIIVSYEIDNTKVIFYDGVTNSSGVINGIVLPTPIMDFNDNEVPKGIEYRIEALYNNTNLIYIVKMYSGIQVIQNINIVPQVNMIGGELFGS